MGAFAFVMLALVVIAILAWSLLSRKAPRNPASIWILIMGLVGVVTLFRIAALATSFQALEIYALALVGVSYVFSFVSARFYYRDPVSVGLAKGVTYGLTKPLRVLYVVPVHNEHIFIIRCVESIINAARYAERWGIAIVKIVIVDDASTDDGKTREALSQFVGVDGVEVINLDKNVGKKGALAIGTAGGTNWREGFKIFEQRFGRKPTRHDTKKLANAFRKAGCKYWPADLIFYTDSDSVIDIKFIYLMVVGFLSDRRIGAISGHCNVWLGGINTLITRMQVAWYYTQFSVRKAAESAFGAVFCVSGPGAGFRREALLHNLLDWVDDMFGDRIYRGATDRKLTLLILMDKFMVVYSRLAIVETVVPQSFEEARSQWTRWKQNFWRMFIPVWQFAWHVHPVVAYMTYTRLLVTVLAPVILAYHLIAFLLGDWEALLIYLAGIGFMGGLMGLSYIASNPAEYRFALYRIAMSWLSAFWGSILTIGALVRTLNNTFTWREKVTNKKGRLINRWFTPTIELRFMELILIILVLINVYRRFFAE